MLDKIFSFFGFNSTQNLVGLCKLTEDNTKPINQIKNPPDKSLKLSDLMRGN